MWNFQWYGNSFAADETDQQHGSLRSVFGSLGDRGCRLCCFNRTLAEISSFVKPGG
jgi:hypothetical protein